MPLTWFDRVESDANPADAPSRAFRAGSASLDEFTEYGERVEVARLDPAELTRFYDPNDEGAAAGVEGFFGAANAV